MSFRDSTQASWASRIRSQAARRALRRRMARPFLEPLEDRTLLTSAWQGLAAALSPATNPLTSALSAAESGLNSLSSSVSGVASSLPFFNGANGVGNLVTNGLSGVGSFLSTISTDLNNLTMNDPTPADSTVAAKLYDALGPSGIGILGDTGHGQVNSSSPAQDYVVITHPAGDTDGSTSVEIELYLTKTLSGSLMLGSGNFFELPGLPVQLTGQVGINYSLSFRYELAFGYDTSFPGNNHGFFIDTSRLLNDFGKTDPMGNALPAHQMSIAASAGLAAGSNVGASLGWFQAYLTDNSSDPTTVGLTLNVDGLDLNAASDVKPTLDGSVGIHLMATAGLGPYENNQFQYLSVGLGLDIDWTFSSSGQDTGPSVSFDDVELELGPAVSGLITPIINDIQDALAPVEPILKVLTTPIPGLSNLSQLVGDGNFTLLTLAEDASNAGFFGPGYDQLVDFIATIVPVLQELEEFQTNGGTLSLDVGDFTLPDGDTPGLVDQSNSYVQGMPASVPLGFDPAASNPSIQSIQDVINDVPGLSSAEQSGLQALQSVLGNQNGISIAFPILDDPTSVLLPLLLNQGNADLFTFHAQLSVLGDLGVDLPSIFGLSVSLNSNVNLQFNVSGGYDTQGISEMINDHFAPGKLLPDFLDGFYVSTGNIVTLEASFAAMVGASFGPASFGAEGGLYTDDGTGTATVSSAKPLVVALSGGNGGKVRPSSFNSNDAPSFQAKGAIYAGLDIYAKLGFNVFGHFIGIQEELDIARVALLSFGSHSPLPSNAPVLATWVNQSMGILQLANLGPNETFVVSPDPDDPGGTLGDVDVTAKGFTEEFEGVKQIDATTSSGNNSITIDPGVAADASLTGGSGSDTLAYEGSGNATLTAGAGDEQLTFDGSAGNGTLLGGRGTDTLIGATGNDSLTAGSGITELVAGSGDDELDGGSGKDTFLWQVGDGPATIAGGSPDNTLEVGGTLAGEEFTVSPDGSGFTVQAPAPASGGSSGPVSLTVTDVQQVDFEGDGGGDTFIINNLDMTSVTTVGINLSQAAYDAGAGNSVVINADPQLADQVQISTGYAATELNDQPVTGVDTNVQITPVNLSRGPLKATAHEFTVSAAIPDSTDALTVNTGANSDTVDILGTQPDVAQPQPGGQVFVNTGDGGDSITVGGSENLDDFFGPLSIDAGGGRNAITFDESGSYIQDSVLLSATQLIRYLPTPPAQPHGKIDAGPEVGYPMIVNYEATHGTFAGGVDFEGGMGESDLYIPQTGQDAPLTVQAEAENVYLGYDGAFPSDQTTVTVQGMSLSAQFPTSVADSTLNGLLSTVTVNANPSTPSANSLEADDEAAPAGETYTLEWLQLPGLEQFERAGSAAVRYSGTNLGFVLDAGNLGNTILVQSVEQGNSATINAGNGTNDLIVADLARNLLGVGVPLTLNGGSGTNNLTMNDEGGPSGDRVEFQPYQVQRFIDTSNPPILINFYGMTTVLYIASDAADQGVGNTIDVEGTAAGTDVTIDTGMHSIVMVGDSGSVQGILGPLNIEDEDGLNAITVDDSSDPTGRTATLSSFLPTMDTAWGSIQGLAPAAINYRYSDTESVAIDGGLQADTFDILSTGSAGGMTSLAIRGGGGTNTLDYSGYVGPVVVDLPLGSATGLSGGISNIEDVVGGNGTNILVGDGGNVLTGGTGYNLLIAGPRESTLLGGSGQNILVGGTTGYDENISALDALLAEWSNTGDSYAQRVNHLLNGGGANGSTTLNASTFQTNGGGNVLTGGAAMSLYYGLLPADGPNPDISDWDPARGEVFIDPNGAEIGIEINATAIGVPQLLLDDSQVIDSATPAEVILHPGGHVLTGPGGTAVSFSVGAGGAISYDPSLQGILTGQGTDTLGVVGAPITFISSLSNPYIYIDYETSDTGPTPYTENLLPGVHVIEGPAGKSAVDFTVGADGTVGYDPSLQGILTGEGTGTLGVVGAAITIDSSLGIEMVLDYYTVESGAGSSGAHLLPGNHVIMEPDGTGEVDFTLGRRWHRRL